MSGSAAEYARPTMVSPEFFRVFAIESIAGRFFIADELTPGGNGAIMISHAYWQSHFGGDARALGQTVRIFGRTLSIVGVMPPSFHFPRKAAPNMPAMQMEQEVPVRTVPARTADVPLEISAA
jgi:hypothetical protein